MSKAKPYEYMVFVSIGMAFLFSLPQKKSPNGLFFIRGKPSDLL